MVVRKLQQTKVHRKSMLAGKIWNIWLVMSELWKTHCITEGFGALDCCAKPEPRVRLIAARCSTGMSSRMPGISEAVAALQIDLWIDSQS